MERTGGHTLLCLLFLLKPRKRRCLAVLGLPICELRYANWSVTALVVRATVSGSFDLLVCLIMDLLADSLVQRHIRLNLCMPATFSIQVGVQHLRSGSKRSLQEISYELGTSLWTLIQFLSLVASQRTFSRFKAWYSTSPIAPFECAMHPDVATPPAHDDKYDVFVRIFLRAIFHSPVVSHLYRSIPIPFYQKSKASARSRPSTLDHPIWFEESP